MCTQSRRSFIFKLIYGSIETFWTLILKSEKQASITTAIHLKKSFQH